MKLLNNLRVRLVLWTVALEATLLLIFAAILVAALHNTQRQQIDETLRLSASDMNAAVDFSGSRFEIPSEDTTALRSRGVLVWILTPEGNVGATVGRAADYALPDPVPLPGEMTDMSLSTGEPVRLFVSPLHEGSRALGTLVLGVSLQGEQVFMRQVLLSLTIALPVVLALSAAGGWFLANRALSPVGVVTATVRHISAADLSQRIELNLPDDEIGQLAHTFNAMLERLDQAFQRERQLTSDVSHELRTPLGMLKTQLSLARSRPREAAQLLQMMADMEGDVDRIAGLVEQLLTLARVEQRGLGDITPIDVGALLQTVVDGLRMKAQENEVGLLLDVPPLVNLQVQGDRERLQQVFTNLIENAIKHTPPRKVVTISANRHWNRLAVSVADTGEGIAPQHLPHLFERFYRVDGDSARTGGGYGLGLAITQAIVQAHQGQIYVESQPGHGTTFTVVLLASSVRDNG
jgi:heavy metal sensor kinase